jgi:hypothetical protein
MALSKMLPAQVNRYPEKSPAGCQVLTVSGTRHLAPLSVLFLYFLAAALSTSDQRPGDDTGTGHDPDKKNTNSAPFPLDFVTFSEALIGIRKRPITKGSRAYLLPKHKTASV